MSNITSDKINEILGITESYQMPEKLLSILLSAEKNSTLEKFINLESDLSYDWFTDYFQTEHSNREKMMQDYTPKDVCKIINLLSSGDVIYDVCSGSGGLTINAWNSNKDATFYCEELSERVLPLLILNCSVRNMNCFIRQGNTLTQEYKTVYQISKAEKFSDIKIISDIQIKNIDLVISNPPYSLSYNPPNSDERFDKYGIPPKKAADYAFVLHGLSKLKNGKAIYILPHGVLFRGNSEGKIRQRLIEDNLIDTIIGLPENMFLNTGIPVCIIIFNKNKKDNSILFIDASKVFVKEGKVNRMTEEAINKVIKTCSSRTFIDKYAYVSSFDEVKNNDFNLNIPRYVETYVKPYIEPISKTIQEIINIEEEIKKAEQDLCKMLNDLVSSGDDKLEYYSSRDKFIKSKSEAEDCSFKEIKIKDKYPEFNTSIVNLKDLSNIERAINKKIYPAGCTLIQISATRGYVLFLEKEGEVETKYAVIIPNNEVDSRYLNIAITNAFDEWYYDNKTGMNIPFSTFDNFKIKYHKSREQQLKIVKIFGNLDNQISKEQTNVGEYKKLKEYHQDKMFPEYDNKHNLSCNEQEEKKEPFEQLELF